MLRIGEVHTEVVVGEGAPGEGGAAGGGASVEVRIEELRETVRLLIEEELERRARRAPAGEGWSTR